MKMVKPLMAILFAFALVIPLQADHHGELECDPNAEYPEAAPGEGEGCGNYLDCNENGVYDVGEPCAEGEQHDGPPPAGGECHCGHVFGENDHHGHCPTCDEALNGEGDWDDHCSSNPDHCPDGGGQDGGPVRFEDVGDGDNCINASEAYDTFGQEETMEEFKAGNDEDPGFDYWASKDSNDDCGNEEVNRKEFFKATYRGLNQMNDEQDMGMGQASLANCAAWCAGIPEYKSKDEDGEWSEAFARYDDEGCPCYPHDGN